MRAWVLGERIAGAGHSVQRTGAPFNERLERFLSAASASR